MFGVLVQRKDERRLVLPAMNFPTIGIDKACDNALMEPINSLYKAECIRTAVFQDKP